MKRTGASASSFFDSVLRPMRCCSRWNGAGAAVQPDQDFAVEHSAVGHGLGRATISGKRSVISSSPRDQIQQRPSRRTSCARMPSNFHSTHHCATDPSRRRHVGSGVSSACARKNG